MMDDGWTDEQMNDRVLNKSLNLPGSILQGCKNTEYRITAAAATVPHTATHTLSPSTVTVTV